jgi:uncharacterized protein (TIGR02246 family)
MKMAHFYLILIALSGVNACGDGATSEALSAADSAAIRAAQAEYVRAWLADDTAAVLATLTRDAMLLPPGAVPMQGDSAIRAYWWPREGWRTTINGFTWDIEEVEGTSDLAYTRGVSALSWTYDKDTVHSTSSSRSVSLTLYRKDADGGWRISRQMWSPLP